MLTGWPHTHDSGSNQSWRNQMELQCWHLFMFLPLWRAI